MARGWTLVLMLACSMARAQDRGADLDARADAIERDRGSDAAADALAHARRALAAASHATTDDARGRAWDIAEAALVLADRLAARARAHLALSDSQQQLTAARERAQRAREALDHALHERARLAEALRAAEAPPPAPPAADGE